MMVLSCLSLTTTPCSVRFGISILLLGLRALGALGFGGCGRGRRTGRSGALLGRDRLDAGDVATDLTHPRGILELSGRTLKAQIELLFLELEHLVIELIDGHVSQIIGFHDRSLAGYSAMR